MPRGIGMASKGFRLPPERGRVKLRILDLEIEGADDSLADSVRNAVSAALTHNGSGRPLPRPVRQSDSSAVLSAADDEIEDDDSVDDNEGQVVRPMPTQPQRRWKPRRMSILELDFDSAPKSLSDFVGELTLDSHMKKFTAIATWFKEYMRTPSINVDHIFTAYKKLKWSDFPRDPIAIFKDLKNKRNYKWFNAGQRGEYEINYIGEQQLAEWRRE